MITIRAATPGDAPALAELRWEFRAGRAPAVEDHDKFIARCTAWMVNALAGSAWRAWVGVNDKRIVGQVWADVIGKLPNPVGERDRHMYLSNLYVQPSERGGVGTELLKTAIAWARANGVDRIILWPSDRSVTLYTRHGFTRGTGVMELDIHRRARLGERTPRESS